MEDSAGAEPQRRGLSWLIDALGGEAAVRDCGDLLLVAASVAIALVMLRALAARRQASTQTLLVLFAVSYLGIGLMAATRFAAPAVEINAVEAAGALVAGVTLLLTCLVLAAVARRELASPGPDALVAANAALEAAKTELEAAHDSLAAHVAARTAELEAKSAALEAANHALALLAHTDVLTGPANRRYLLERLGVELERARRYASPLTVAMIDLDDFKAVNDHHGHHVGDAVLARIGEVLRAGVRTSDIAARWGGEEFIVVMPEVGITGAVALLERLQTQLAQLPVHTSGSVVTIRCSAGVACSAGNGAGSDVLIRAADRALYEAKAAGKNRVHVGVVAADDARTGADDGA